MGLAGQDPPLVTDHPVVPRLGSPPPGHHLFLSRFLSINWLSWRYHVGRQDTFSTSTSTRPSEINFPLAHCQPMSSCVSCWRGCCGRSRLQARVLSSYLAALADAQGLFKVLFRWLGLWGRALRAATVLVTKSASFQPAFLSVLNAPGAATSRAPERRTLLTTLLLDGLVVASRSSTCPRPSLQQTLETLMFLDLV